MYLKSLVLKGFKSFVDRSVISLEPGITVVVGPNGSGKSNISDAILWVLGEQSAKQLRGQAMEDVIFSGSSARQPAGVAEVDLVLDNSDGVLPLEFNEIVITRRMYRNGESEYLINGSPALLRDILDILHDTGIGRDTHSIISQGALTAIVEGKPEMRRDLIEEAAGILKHKKRKERSARKIAAMDANLDRIHDVSREIDRQLRPLERQAARAREFQTYDDERRDLELALAVDDLRNLQAEWSGIEKRVKEAEAEIEVCRVRYVDRESELVKLQKTLEEKGLFVGDLTEQRGRCQSLLERVDANEHLLEEKSRNMVERASELATTVQKSKARLAAARRESRELAEESEQAQAAYEVYVKDNAELTREGERIRRARSESDDEYNHLSASLRSKQRAIDECKLTLARSKQAISTNALEDEMLSRRYSQIDEQVATAQNSLAERRGRMGELDEALGKAKRESEQAAGDIAKRERLLEYSRKDLEAAREKHTQAKAEIRGIEEIDRAFETASPALSWVITHEDEFEGMIRPVSDMFSTDESLEHLVERLLGADLFGLVIDDPKSAELIATRLVTETAGEGEISLVPAHIVRAARRERPRAGHRLLDDVTYPAERADAAEALLGDVYLVDTVADAIAAQAADTTASRFATRDGVVVWPSGKITLGIQNNDVEGVMERARRLEALRTQLDEATSELSEVEMRISEAEHTLKVAQEDGFELAQTIAQLSGERDSVREEVGRLEQTLTSLSAERTEIARQRDEVATKSASAQPLIAEYEQRLETLSDEIADLEERIAAGADMRAQRAKDSADIVERIQACKVGLATSNTKSVYLRQRLNSLSKEIGELEHTLDVSIRTQASLAVLAGRVDPLYEVFTEIGAGIKVWAAKIRDQAQLEQSDSASLKDTIEQARHNVTDAKSALDAKIASVSDVRIEMGKLEMQVDAAVKSIVGEDDISLEEALAIPSPADRAGAEDRLRNLKRRISSIGPVNQVARQEYEALKQRHDFIESQVADLEGARKALAKIDAAIDRKMRNRFIETFEEVDANFQTIFSELFPGGHAHLALTDPDNPEESGVNIVAQPPGKKILKNSLMSGGEMSLSALALLFAVYRTRTVPFYVLDEVEAALDDTNMRRLVAYLDSMRDRAQFILITHQRRTMEIANVLYGVSMQGDGVSKVVSQKLERAIAAYAEDATPEEVQAAIDKDPDFVRPATPAHAMTKGHGVSRMPHARATGTDGSPEGV